MDSFDLYSFGDLLDDHDFSLPLIIGLSAGLASLFVILILLAVFLTFSNNPIFLGSNFNVPGEFDDEENRLHEEATELPKLSEQERQIYLAAKNFQLQNPPIVKPLGETLSEIESQYVNERGIQAYEFEIPIEWFGSRYASISIEDKLDLTFNSNFPSSTILNYPVPISTTTDTTYFEVKLFSKPENTIVCVGVSSKPYPLFTLPGHHKYSLAYDSTGRIRINEPFSTPAIFNKLQQGDIIGVGFKQRTGSIFFTHNGKKIHDAIHNLKFDLYPHIGSIGNCQLSVNLGQLGFVYIEANVKKWGFGSVTGVIGIPPPYGKEVGEILDKGEELPPTYPSEEETFFGPSALLSRATAVIGTPITQNRKNRPPSYKEEPKQLISLDESQDQEEQQGELNEGLYERRSSSYDLTNNVYNIEIGSSSQQQALDFKTLSKSASKQIIDNTIPESDAVNSPEEVPQVLPIEPSTSVDEVLELTNTDPADPAEATEAGEVREPTESNSSLSTNTKQNKAKKAKKKSKKRKK